MAISPSQCRAARALLGWSQEDLERHAGIAKKTIADFERDARSPHERSNKALQSTLEAHGVVFIPQNGGGAGVRLKLPLPQLFRRNDVPERNWIAFAFDYKNRREVGFVYHDALAKIAPDKLKPIQVFDRDEKRILVVAAKKADCDERDDTGRVHIKGADLTV
jgi:transcriptional regulator with XRE-family HTH domain